jgi:hypothetical protein
MMNLRDLNEHSILPECQRRPEGCICMEKIHSFVIERLNLLGGPFIQNRRGDYPKRWGLMDV